MLRSLYKIGISDTARECDLLLLVCSRSSTEDGKMFSTLAAALLAQRSDTDPCYAELTGPL
jgi:hypothetical protein